MWTEHIELPKSDNALFPYILEFSPQQATILHSGYELLERSKKIKCPTFLCKQQNQSFWELYLLRLGLCGWNVDIFINSSPLLIYSSFNNQTVMKLRWLQDEQKMQNGQSKHSDYFFQVIIQTVTHTYEHTHWTCTLCLIKKRVIIRDIKIWMFLYCLF